MTVNLTRIYTKLGDGGETHLGDMSRVPKTHPRIEAYGAIDELNAQIGLTLTVDGLPEQYAEWLRHVQNDLFDAGADLSVPPGGEGGRERLRLAAEQTVWLEEACDEINATLAPLRSFVLPGGTQGRRPPPRLPDRVPPRRAPRHPGRGRQPRGRALPQPPLGPALHPQPRRECGRGAPVGAGALPVDAHRRRPPIPIVPVDARARDAAAARGADPVAVWVAAVTGSADPPRIRTVDTSAIDVLRTTLAPFRDAAGMDVAHVALAVDAGRAIAAQAAAEGAAILVAGAPAARDDTAARALAAVLTGASGPVPNGALGALRRLGDASTAVLCGVALGAGEHGLGCVCDGLAALAGAAVAAGIEADLRPRLAGGRPSADPAYAALAAHLGVADGAALAGLPEDPPR